MLRKTSSILTIGALVAAASATVSGQDTNGSNTNALPANSTVPTAKAGEASSSTKSLIRLDGTDLRLGRLPPITFHGFASQGLLTSTDYNYLGKTAHGLGSAEFNEFGLNASISPLPRTRIAAQAFMFDIGNVGNYSPTLDYALVDYNVCDEFGVRGGRIRKPQGIYNHIQDIDVARTSVLLPQGMYDARYRDFSGTIDGGSLYGNVALGKAGSLSYEAFCGMVNLSEEGGVARLLQDNLNRAPISSYGQVNGFPQAGVQLWWMTPLQGLRAGVSLKQAYDFSYDYRVNPPFGPGGIRTEMNVPSEQYSLEYQYKSWTFQAEYGNQNSLAHNIVGGNVVSHNRTRSDTWYVGAAYRFNKWFEVGSYYTEFYSNVDHRSGSGMAVPSDAYQKDATLSLRFDPKPWWTIKLEGHAINGTGLLYNNHNNPVRNDDTWFMLAAKTTFSF